jgi:hypothetical protein
VNLISLSTTYQLSAGVKAKFPDVLKKRESELARLTSELADINAPQAVETDTISPSKTAVDATEMFEEIGLTHAAATSDSYTGAASQSEVRVTKRSKKVEKSKPKIIAKQTNKVISSKKHTSTPKSDYRSTTESKENVAVVRNMSSQKSVTEKNRKGIELFHPPHRKGSDSVHRTKGSESASHTTKGRSSQSAESARKKPVASTDWFFDEDDSFSLR